MEVAVLKEICVKNSVGLCFFVFVCVGQDGGQFGKYG